MQDILAHPATVRGYLLFQEYVNEEKDRINQIRKAAKDSLKDIQPSWTLDDREAQRTGQDLSEEEFDGILGEAQRVLQIDPHNLVSEEDRHERHAANIVEDMFEYVAENKVTLPSGEKSFLVVPWNKLIAFRQALRDLQDGLHRLKEREECREAGSPPTEQEFDEIWEEIPRILNSAPGPEGWGRLSEEEHGQNWAATVMEVVIKALSDWQAGRPNRDISEDGVLDTEMKEAALKAMKTLTAMVRSKKGKTSSEESHLEPVREGRAPAEGEAGSSRGPGTLSGEQRGEAAQPTGAESDGEGSQDPAHVPLPGSDSAYSSASSGTLERYERE